MIFLYKNKDSYMNNKRILVISSYSPSYSGGLGSDIINAFQNEKYEVDYLSIELDKRRKEVKATNIDRLKVQIRNIAFKQKHLSKFYHKLSSIKNYIKFMKRPYLRPIITNSGISIHYPFEDTPPFEIKKILEEINKPYDIVITLFWHLYINSTTLKAIYDKLKCPVLIYAIDMAPFTGGCFYFNDCRNFSKECINCPAEPKYMKLQCHKNYLIKKHNYSNMTCAFLSNSWVNQFALKSNLFDKNQIKKIGFIVDEDKYRIDNNIELINIYNLQHNDLILLMRSSDAPRKGCDYIVNSISRLYYTLNSDERNKFKIITVGDDYIQNKLSPLGITIINLGKVSFNKLIEAYHVSSFFLSASIDDAGPSMINQSIMCGTPVVSFNTGCAIVINETSGFITNDISEEEFLKTLTNAYYYFKSCNYKLLREKTKIFGLSTSSKKAIARKMIEIAENISKRDHD